MYADRNESTPGAANAEGHAPTAGTADSVVSHMRTATAGTMHSPAPIETIRSRDRVMAEALAGASPEDKARITAALQRGWTIIGEGRAEDALRAAGFTWPESAPPRALGALVKQLAATGLIIQQTITKGLSLRSHAGRVSWWRWCGEVGHG